MKKRYLTGVLLLASCALAAPALAEHHETAGGWVEDLVGNLQFTGGRLMELAEATPAEKFGWRPNEEVRTVSEVYMHVAAANMLMPSGFGAAPPEGLEMPEGGPMALAQQWEKEVTDKDAVIAKLEASFSYAAEAIRGLENLEEQVSMFGMEASRRAFLLILQGHAHEHLGQSIAYARTMGIVPPWSRPAPEESGAEPES